jgi:acyl-CoA-dependent ceramide synthase
MAETVDVMNVRISPSSVGQQEGFDYMPNCMTNFFFPNPLRSHAELSGGFAGSGLYWENLPLLWPTLVFAVIWFCARWLSKTYVFPPLASLLGIKGKKKQDKFCYNLWLLVFYGSSSLYGWFVVLPGEKYFAFPVDKDSGLALMNHHPWPIQDKVHWQYVYQLGFYFAELYAIFVEPKRSDFLEYLFHHLVTILLVGGSYLANHHRVGAIIFFMHDVPDVFLCISKTLIYIGFQNLAGATFVLFGAVFFYLRIYCFPLMSYAIFCLIPQSLPATYMYWVNAISLGIALQGLQVFWFVMIVKLFLTAIVFRGSHQDPRSDDDDDEPGHGEHSKSTKPKKKLGTKSARGGKQE